MKNKKWIALAAAVVLAVTALPMGVFAAKKDSTEEKLTKVTLNEVAHSIFYAPQYVAIEEGYFAEKGLDLTLVTGFGADKTMTAVISGETDIGFMGAEASVYAYQEGATDPVVNFAQLTQRAENFLVAREEKMCIRDRIIAIPERAPHISITPIPRPKPSAIRNISFSSMPNSWQKEQATACAQLQPFSCNFVACSAFVLMISYPPDFRSQAYF